MKNTLIEYVRVARGSRKGQPRGVVVATAAGCVGWSYVNLKAGDTFDKERGLQIALARCKGLTNKQVPYDVAPVIRKMVIRSEKYFKQVGA